MAFMDPLPLPASLIRKVQTRRGRAHAFESLVATRTALVVIDMQRAFVEADGMDAAQDIVPTINRLAAALRHAGGTVVWVQSTMETWPAHMRDVLGSSFDRLSALLVPGQPGYDLWPELDVKDGDWRLEKQRYSAFHPEACDLTGRLRAAGVDTVLIAGAMTNICCESSARDAVVADFRTIMVADANATDGDEAHRSTLMTFYRSFGDVRTTDDLAALLSAEKPTG